jgi:GT2 family glycosyltransferase
MKEDLTIGIASYGNAEKLRATLKSICEMSVTNYKVVVIHNPGAADDDAARKVIAEYERLSDRVFPIWMPQNVGYVGAVNKLLELADTEYVAYCDNDIEIRTHGWDVLLIKPMLDYDEIGWVFPGRGHYGFYNGQYHECLWNAGYCWMLRRKAVEDVSTQRRGPLGAPLFDTALGHHEEVDYMIRLRLHGWRVACRPDVTVLHHETATKRSEEDHKPGGRIHDGVVRWMNKWNGYFAGDELKYSMTRYDDRMLRFTDWNVDALYLERMTLASYPQLNAHPESVHVPGVGEMDVIKVLKPKGCYVGRAI